MQEDGLLISALRLFSSSAESLTPEPEGLALQWDENHLLDVGHGLCAHCRQWETQAAIRTRLRPSLDNPLNE